MIRHPTGSADTVFYSMNLVHRHDHRTWLRTSSDGPQDNHIGVVRPVPVALVDLDLDATAFLDSASNDSGDRKDELLVFDNTDPSLNKVPSTTYFRVAGEWREDDGNTYPVADTATIAPSSAIVIRKSATVDGAPVLWINSPRY